MKDKANLRGWLIVILSGVFLILMARGAGALPQVMPETVESRFPEATASRTPVPTVTGFPTRTPTLTPTDFPPGTPTFTPTPTSQPGPPTLVSPPDRGLLPQPVAPNDWFFQWDARHGPCYTSISIYEPGGRSIYAQRQSDETYEFEYTADAYLPDDALGPWRWGVYVGCPLGQNHSEERTFWVQPPPVRYRYLPLVEKGPR